MSNNHKWRQWQSSTKKLYINRYLVNGIFRPISLTACVLSHFPPPLPTDTPPVLCDGECSVWAGQIWGHVLSPSGRSPKWGWPHRHHPDVWRGGQRSDSINRLAILMNMFFFMYCVEWESVCIYVVVIQRYILICTSVFYIYILFSVLSFIIWCVTMLYKI